MVKTLGDYLTVQYCFADKKVNSAGLPLVDHLARLMGMYVLRPMHENRAFDVLKKKFFCSGCRKNVGKCFENWGLKIYPPDGKKPR